jgi:tRNA pseudouridine65 synthase
MFSRLPLGRGVKLLSSDPCGLFAVFKPASILSHPNKKEDRKRSVIDADYNYDQEAYLWKISEGNMMKIYLLNRLDSATSGLVLLSLNEPIADQVRKKFQEGTVLKKYRALVFGNFPHATFRWTDQINSTATAEGKLRSFVSRGAIAITQVKFIRDVLQHPVPISVVELIPETGRTHQLRVQCAHHGFPIVGDKVYGDFTLNRLTKKMTNFGGGNLCLLAQSLEISITNCGQICKFSVMCDIPEYLT